MIICDKCKQNKKTRVIVFGCNMFDWRFNDNWDLCVQCEKEIIEQLQVIIGTPSRKQEL